MAWTVLSTPAQLKADLPVVKDTDMGDDELAEIIDDAKEVLYDDLSKFVDWDEMEDLSVVPRFLNRLSRYQAAMLTIERKWYNDETMIGGGEGPEENTLYTVFKGKYSDLMEQIKEGSIKLLDVDNEELEADVARTPGIGRII